MKTDAYHFKLSDWLQGVSSSNMEAELKRVSQNSELKRNPYLSGEPLRTVAKKGSTSPLHPLHLSLHS